MTDYLVYSVFPGQEQMYINMLKDYDYEGKVTFGTEELPIAKKNSEKYDWTLPWIAIVAHGVPEVDAYSLYHRMCLGYGRCLHDLKLQPYQREGGISVTLS